MRLPETINQPTVPEETAVALGAQMLAAYEAPAVEVVGQVQDDTLGVGGGGFDGHGYEK